MITVSKTVTIKGIHFCFGAYAFLLCFYLHCFLVTPLKSYKNICVGVKQRKERSRNRWGQRGIFSYQKWVRVGVWLSTFTSQWLGLMVIFAPYSNFLLM